jgi:hypothetical protein
MPAISGAGAARFLSVPFSPRLSRAFAAYFLDWNSRGLPLA